MVFCNLYHHNTDYRMSAIKRLKIKSKQIKLIGGDSAMTYKVKRNNWSLLFISSAPFHKLIYLLLTVGCFVPQMLSIRLNVWFTWLIVMWSCCCWELLQHETFFCYHFPSQLMALATRLRLKVDDWWGRWWAEDGSSSSSTSRHITNKATCKRAAADATLCRLFRRIDLERDAMLCSTRCAILCLPATTSTNII